MILSLIFFVQNLRDRCQEVPSKRLFILKLKCHVHIRGQKQHSMSNKTTVVITFLQQFIVQHAILNYVVCRIVHYKKSVVIIMKTDVTFNVILEVKYLFYESCGYNLLLLCKIYAAKQFVNLSSKCLLQCIATHYMKLQIFPIYTCYKN